jgi:hypothetical protein
MTITLEDIIQTSLTRGDKGQKGDIGNLRDIAGVSDVFTAKTGATGTVTHDVSSTNIFVHTSLSDVFTANFINVPETNTRITNLILVLIQGSTAYMPNAFQIDDASRTVKWGGGVAPTGTANGIDVINYILIRDTNAWTILGQHSTYQ